VQIWNAARDLYCCLLPQCVALRTCCSGFLIATLQVFAPGIITPLQVSVGVATSTNTISQQPKQHVDQLVTQTKSVFLHMSQYFFS